MKPLIFSILGISILVNIILLQHFFFSSSKVTPSSQSNTYSQYPFLSRRIFIENQNDLLLNFVELRSQLRKYHEKVKEPFGIYFEYLPTGVSVGINEKDNFVLASLLKVPLVMGIYKRIENNEIERDTLYTISEEDLDPFFGKLWKKGAGTQLSVEQLINSSLIESDNTAQRTLFRNSPDFTLENVFDSLDIPKELSGTQPVVTPKNYSSVLRSLYLSSYLTRENSNEILDILTRTSFNSKIPGLLPAEVKVAHKIGVHLGGTNANSVYTDCGIIYVPLRPYILCLMIKSDEEIANEHMSKVSKIVYDYVNIVNATPNAKSAQQKN